MLPTPLQFDNQYFQEYDSLIGIDEVGRGALAGPILSVAFEFNQPLPSLTLNDSKKLNKKTRQTLIPLLLKHVKQWSIGLATPSEIDSLGIQEANYLCFQRAINQCSLQKKTLILADGTLKPWTPLYQIESLVKGDTKSLSIMAASILAKESRDTLMEKLSEKYSQYGFHTHVGYGTAYHREQIKKYGYSSIHRHSFKLKEKTFND